MAVLIIARVIGIHNRFGRVYVKYESLRVHPRVSPLPGGAGAPAERAPHRAPEHHRPAHRFRSVRDGDVRREPGPVRQRPRVREGQGRQAVLRPQGRHQQE